VPDTEAVKDVNVKIDYLARCEGEIGLHVQVSADGQVREWRVDLYEPPRFFEGFLVGRKWYDAYETCSRICGICSMPHTISGIEATELAFGIKPDPQTVTMRKLANLSELNMNSIVTNFILGGPDFFRKNDVFEVAAEEQFLPLVKKALKFKRLGNDLSDFITGRETHPIAMDVGRMLTFPDRRKIPDLLRRLEEAREFAWEMAEVSSTFKPLVPFKRKAPLVAIHSDEEYAVNYGQIHTTTGLKFDPEDHDKYIRNTHVERSNALFYTLEGKESFAVGPIARVVINFDQLSENAKKVAKKYWGGPEWFHENMPFSVYAAHAVDYMHTVDEFIDTLKTLDTKPNYKDKAVHRKGQGYICTEAPRGLLYYSFAFDEKGDVTFADVVTPTAHQVYNMENDFKELAPMLVGLNDSDATLMVEMLAHTYDLCNSCSVHCVRMVKK
jgi:sulfhydrogenase subunit alpha